MKPVMHKCLRLVLPIFAIVYFALACLHTIGDFDTGWHLATGRYLLLHHVIPSTDILSYTSPSAPWHYPPFAGALLYLIFHAFGYTGLTWFCVFVSAMLAVYLLWRALPQANLSTAALLIFAVPSLAYRITPRADLFSTLFFAVFLIELWRYHRGISTRLWVLPIVMVLWVNLHPGFVAGIGLIASYLLFDALLLPFSDLNTGARRRLLRAWPWLSATAVAIFVNPWGAGVIRQAFRLAGFGGNGQTLSRNIGELSREPLSWHVLTQALELRNPDSSFWWLLVAAALAMLQALRRRQFGAVLLLVLSMAAALQKLRYQGLFSIVVIVVGGTLLAELVAELSADKSRVGFPVRPWATVALVAILCSVVSLRAADLISNRYYVVSASLSDFGPGESWWFPEHAATFIERERLPGNIFQPYNLGGFTAIRLGPNYLDYTDGRGVSGAISDEEQYLFAQSPDSPYWQQVAQSRNINVVLLSVARYGGLGFDLDAFCGARSEWRPVYFDEVSIVLLRRTPQNMPWLERLELNCQSAQFARPAQSSRATLYNFYANSGAVLYALARDVEAENALHKALELEPEDPNVRLFLGQLYQQKQRFGDAEQEYRAALSRRESSVAWYALGRLLALQHRYAEAEPAIKTAALMTATPSNQYKALGQVQLHLSPEHALESFLKAEREGPQPNDPSPTAIEFRAQLAEGRGRAWLAMQDAKRATTFAEESTKLAPDPRRWNLLADCYAAQGRSMEADQARNRAKGLLATQ